MNGELTPYDLGVIHGFIFGMLVVLFALVANMYPGKDEDE